MITPLVLTMLSLE